MILKINIKYKFKNIYIELVGKKDWINKIRYNKLNVNLLLNILNI